jgi:hypothetical protein
LTAPATTIPAGFAPAAASRGRNGSIAAFIARPASISSGTKNSSSWKSLPTSSIAGIIVWEMSAIGSAPAMSSSLTIVRAACALPSTIALNSVCDNAIVVPLLPL